MVVLNNVNKSVQTHQISNMCTRAGCTKLATDVIPFQTSVFTWHPVNMLLCTDHGDQIVLFCMLYRRKLEFLIWNQNFDGTKTQSLDEFPDKDTTDWRLIHSEISALLSILKTITVVLKCETIDERMFYERDILIDNCIMINNRLLSKNIVVRF